MLKEFQDAAAAAERKERLNTLVPIVAAMVFSIALVLMVALQ